MGRRGDGAKGRTGEWANGPRISPISRKADLVGVLTVTGAVADIDRSSLTLAHGVRGVTWRNRLAICRWALAQGTALVRPIEM
jgi:hypothetical protein